MQAAFSQMMEMTPFMRIYGRLMRNDNKCDRRVISSPYHSCAVLSSKKHISWVRNGRTQRLFSRMEQRCLHGLDRRRAIEQKRSKPKFRSGLRRLGDAVDTICHAFA
jgi:hypothetical protein